MSECYLSHPGVYVPAGRYDVDEILGATQAPHSHRMAKVFKRLYGLNKVAAAPAEQSPEQSLGYALSALYAREGELPVDLVLYAHALMARPAADPTRFPVSESIPRMGVSHMNCASLMQALAIGQRVLEGNDTARRVLILAGDQLSGFPLEKRYLAGTTVMGDACVAFYLQTAPSAYRLENRALVTLPRFAEGMGASEAALMEFHQTHDSLLSQCIEATLGPIGENLSGVSWVLPHNVNLAVWERFAETASFPRERIFTDLIPEIGHTFSVDPFLGLAALHSQAVLRGGDRCLLTTVGLGGFAGALALRVQ